MSRTIFFHAPLMALLVSGCAPSVHVENTPVVAAAPVTTPLSVDLVGLLPPPPPLNSDADKADRAAVMDIQRSRTQAMCDRAQADTEFSARQFFRRTKLTYEPTLAPAVETIIASVSSLQMAATNKAKAHFLRPRPYESSPDIISCITRLPNSSYPAGHAMWAYAVAIIFSHMLPDKRDILFTAAADYSRQRIIGGIHYPTDIEAGRIGGTLLADHLLSNADFLAKVDAATPELRRALGL